MSDVGVATRVVSWSELDAIRQCRYKHRLGYMERWRPAEEAETLSRGRLFHEVMERHYAILRLVQAGAEWESDEVLELKYQTRTLLADPDTARQTPEQELVEWMYRGYQDVYGADSDWKVVAVEHPIEEWLPTVRGTRSSFRLKGKIDLVVRDMGAGGGLWVVDHKTCKDLPKGGKDIDLDDQFAIYQWLMQRRGNNIRGVIYNAVRTYRLKTREMVPEERFKRVYTVRSDAELTTVVEEAYEQYREAYRGATLIDVDEDPDDGVDDRVDKRVDTESMADPPRSPDPDRCRWRCPFTEPCLAGRKGADTRQLLLETGFKQDFRRH